MSVVDNDCVEERLASLDITAPTPKRVCANLMDQDSPSPTMLDVGFYEFDATDSTDANTLVAQDFFDLMPSNVLSKIIEYTGSQNSLDDMNIVSLALTKKRQHRMLYEAQLHSICRITSRRRFRPDQDYSKFTKLLLSQEKPLSKPPLPFTGMEVTTLVAHFTSLVHLSIDTQDPDYGAIVPLLPITLESLHLSNWGMVNNDLDDTSLYLQSALLQPQCLEVDSILATSKEYSFGHLGRLLRLSLFSFGIQFLDGTLIMNCNRLQLPTNLVTLHMPYTMLDVNHHYNLPVPGWSTITTLSAWSIKGDAPDFYLPSLNRLVSYGDGEWLACQNLDTIVTKSCRLLSTNYPSVCANTVVYIVSLPGYDNSRVEKIVESYNSFEKADGIVRPKIVSLVETLDGINVCKHGKTRWLSRLLEL